MTARHPAGEHAATLEARCPLHERVAGLLVRWNHEACRWMVCQVLPPHATPILVCAPDQPLARHAQGFLYPDPAAGQIRLMREMVDQMAWDIYEATGRYSRSYWVVQGEQGGHKRRFTSVERDLAKLHGFVSQPPSPGALPYAPVDQRVLDKVLLHDQVDAWNYALSLDQRHPEHFDADERRGLRVVREQLWGWMESQVERRWDEAYTRQSRPEIRTDPNAPDVDYETLKERVLNGEM